MSTRAISFHTLACDGCEVPFGMDTYYSSLIEARAAAYAAGWRFPEKLRRNGGESKTVSDVCPGCTDGWKPQAAQDTWKNRRAS